MAKINKKTCTFQMELLPLQRVFHGIRLLRLIEVGCRETTYLFRFYALFTRNTCTTKSF